MKAKRTLHKGVMSTDSATGKTHTIEEVQSMIGQFIASEVPPNPEQKAVLEDLMHLEERLLGAVSRPG